MTNLSLRAPKGEYITEDERKKLLQNYVDAISDGVSSILIIPPDSTRKPSGTGLLTRDLYFMLKDQAEVSIMPALGTHEPMARQEIEGMFGEDIPMSTFVEHRWRQDTEKIGTIPAEFVNRVSEGAVNDEIEVEINKRLLSNKYDKIISIGQVLPHEVVGMANYSKNIFVGCGGPDMINKSHYVGAAYGLEKLMGKDHSPVRKLYDYAEKEFLQDIPLEYILTVNSSEIVKETGLTRLLGLFIGKDRKVFENAVQLSQKRNITKLDTPAQKFVVYLDEEEFNSTWVGCKAIYRTRMAVADGGEIIVIAPGLSQLGEDEDFDKLIRKYGYVGKEKIIKLVNENRELQENLAAPAHLIHGSSNGRFQVTFASNSISREEIEGVNHNYMPLERAREIYQPSLLDDGYNTLDNGEEVYFISNPATGLWVAEDRFQE